MLDLVPRAVPRRRRWSATRQTLTTLAFGFLVLLGFIGLCWAAFVLFVMPSSERGTCFVADPQQCSSLSVAAIEEAANVTIPSGATIVGSGSRRSLKSGLTSAAIQLPPGARLGLGAGYGKEDFDVVGVRDLSITTPLRERGITKVSSLWQERRPLESTTSTVVLGTDEHGVRWAYIAVDWDG